MSEQTQGLQPKLNQLFRAVVAEYDGLSIHLVVADFSMRMVRGVLPQESRTEMDTRGDMNPSNVSGEEGHSIGDGCVWGGLIIQGTFSEPDKIQILANDFLRECGNAKVAIFNRAACYLKVKGMKIAAEMEGIPGIDWPDDTQLRAALLTPPFRVPSRF